MPEAVARIEARKTGISAYLSNQKRLCKPGSCPMSALYPLSVHRRVERQWAERMKSLRQIRAGIVDVAERALQGAFNEPIPVKIRTFGDREKQYR